MIQNGWSLIGQCEVKYIITLPIKKGLNVSTYITLVVMSVSILITALNTSSDYAFDIFKIYTYHVCQFNDDKVSISIYTGKSAQVVTSIKQSPVLKGRLFLVLS